MESLNKDFQKMSLKPKEKQEESKADKTKVPLNTEKTLMTEGNKQESKVYFENQKEKRIYSCKDYRKRHFWSCIRGKTE